MGDVTNPEPSPHAEETDTSNPTSAGAGEGAVPPASPPPHPPLSLIQPIHKKKHKPIKVLRAFRSVFRSFPILTPACKFPFPVVHPDASKITGGTRVTGTLFGLRRGKVTLSIQEDPKCLPMLVVELPILTNLLQKEIGSGMVRMALECDKRPEKDKTKLMEEPLWTVYFNGKNSGYGVKREASEEDLGVMEVLRAVSMGAGVVPGKSGGDNGGQQDDELAYIRAHFERVVGSRDSETLYMLSPNGDNGPELSIFFVRV